MANDQFGDFQTNDQLANKIVSKLKNICVSPKTIIEPTCGQGNFIYAALTIYPDATVHGLEIQKEYINVLEKRFQFSPRFILHEANYFDFDWQNLISRMQSPIWVIGNPPWVTNTFLSKLESKNLPKKSPQADVTGYDSQTGKSNFDISESMIRDWLEWGEKTRGVVCAICKKSVARKVLQWWWKKPDKIVPKSQIYEIDAKLEFNASVVACVLICDFSVKDAKRICQTYKNFENNSAPSVFGFIDNKIVANVQNYNSRRNLLGSCRPKWRSGIKHDAGKVLELKCERGGYVNRLLEFIELESDFIFPLVKGSDLNKGDPFARKKAMIVTQTFIGEKTERIKEKAPKTWKYLTSHLELFKKRKSVIYKKGDDFSIFGIGDYTFAPWKIAIGALYKTLDFRLIGPVNGRPVVFDDTVYFMGFDNKLDAELALAKLRMTAVREFLDSMIFWDDMRPVKTEILNSLDLSNVRKDSTRLLRKVELI